MNAHEEKCPAFKTERFDIVPLSPAEARNLLAVLLQDENLASRVPWMIDKSQDGAQREAFCIELQCASGAIKVWGIVAREHRMLIGAIIARNSLEGIDVEVLIASQFWDAGVVDEAGDPVVEWLEHHSNAIHPATRHY
jgi:hypothetical protein